MALSNELNIPIVLDIEASGFGQGSYPIEIGVAMSDGGAHCYLIQPQSDWNHWEQQAENLHQITRQTLQRFGWDVRHVARQLNRFLAGKTVYSDAWGYDSAWMALLFDRAGIRQRFQVEHVAKIITQAQMSCWEATKVQVIRELGLQRHRASADARIIQTTWLRTLAWSQVASM